MHWDVKITESKKLRRAYGQLRDGAIHIQLPERWRRKDKNDAVEELVEKIRRDQQREEKLLATLESIPATEFITLATQKELEAYVVRLNEETFQAPLKKVRLGHARYTRLAQLNVKTHTMTVSSYSLQNVPKAALRYLIVHELAHFYEFSHNKYFWSLVARFVPDYRKQSRIIKACHRRNTENLSESSDNNIKPETSLHAESIDGQKDFWNDLHKDGWQDIDEGEDLDSYEPDSYEPDFHQHEWMTSLPDKTTLEQLEMIAVQLPLFPVSQTG